MPFGLTNAPATCQQFVNDVLREYLDLFVVVYLDDILIYSENSAQHDDHVFKVLRKLREYGLFCKPGGLSMDPSKVQTIQEWKPPSNVRGVQSFLGFANFYRRFIKMYSEIAAPLFQLTRKNSKFSEPILRHFDPALPTVLETDASN